MKDSAEVIYFLRLLTNSKPSFRKILLTNLPQKQCELIRQVALNILLNTSIELSDQDKVYLRSKKKIIQLIASKKVCAAEKRSILKNNQETIKKIATITINYLS